MMKILEVYYRSFRKSRKRRCYYRREKGTDTYVDVVEGMQFDRGYFLLFCDRLEKMEADLESPHILLYDKKISAMKDLLPILEPVAQTGKPLL